MKKMMIFCMTVLMAVAGMAQNVRTDMEKLREIAAMDNGKAQMVLARHYVDGDSVPVNYMTAVHWYSHAFQNGEEKALRKEFSRLGKNRSGEYYGFMKYLEGNVEMFVNEDFHQAFDIYNDGYTNGIHPNELLVMMISCVGADVEPEKLEHVLKDKNKDDLKKFLLQTSPMVQISVAMGTMEQGDTAQAIRLMEKVSESGIPFASDYLGMWYLQCKKPYYDIDKAIAHFQQAERNKVLTHGDSFAFCYEHELGGLKYDKKRIKELREKYTTRHDPFHAFHVWLDNEGILDEQK